MLFKKKFVSIKKKKFIKVKPKANFLERKKEEISTTLELLAKINFNITMPMLQIVLGILAVMGILIGIIASNFMLGIIFMVTLPALFLEYLALKKVDVESYIEKQVVQYAELIKNSFISTRNVMTTIKNITPRMNQPCKRIFEEMIVEVDAYNISVENALQRMGNKLHSKALNELIEQLILCQRDQRFISSLQTATKFMADKREFLQRWEMKIKTMYEKLILIVIMVNVMAFASYFMYRDIFMVFIESKQAKIVIPLFFLAQVFSILLSTKKIKSVQF